MHRPNPFSPRPSRQRRASLRSSGLLVGLAVAQACLVWPTAAQAAGPAGYRLGPQDRVRLKVFEWRPSRDELYAWTALNDEFTISADGTLSIPIVGEVVAAGLPPREVGRAIGAQLQKRMGLVEPPDTAVEIVQYRPFYIDGQVERPGEYPFRPGLTLAKALAIAGGPPRVNDAAMLRLERDAINARGELMLLRQEREQHMMRLARLLAEKDGRDKITIPKEIAARPAAATAQLIERETSIFDARRKAITDQVEAIEDLKRFLRMQLDTLTAQMATAESQVKLIESEIRSNQLLADRGLATQTRQVTLGRSMAQMESEKLRINTDILRARETITRSDLSLIEQRSKRDTDIAMELRETQKLLDQVARRIETTERLVLEAEVTAPRSLADRALAQRAKPNFRIARQTDDRPVDIAADEATPVLPGDTITVSAPTAVDEVPARTPAHARLSTSSAID